MHHAFAQFLHRLCTTTMWKDQILKFSWECEWQGDKFYCVCLSSDAVLSLQLQLHFPTFKRLDNLELTRKFNSLNYDPNPISQWCFCWRYRWCQNRGYNTLIIIICQTMCKRDVYWAAINLDTLHCAKLRS